MSPLELSGQVVDTPATKEFLDRALERISREDCRSIAADCERKAALVGGVLHRGGCTSLDDDRLRWFLRTVFATRRRVDAVLEAARPGGGLGALLESLCWGDAALEQRVDAFVGALSGLGDEELACDLAGEALHFTRPGDHWLAARWMWSPSRRTGALALVTTDADLTGSTPGETYARIGLALLMLRASADAAGLLNLGPEPWDLDVLLACVYCVYLYTITRLRMTQEFNKVIPPLPDLARRFLGVHRLEEAA